MTQAKTCECAKCANPGCQCGTRSEKATGDCCCGPGCQCGEACKCAAGCGCPAARKA